MRPLGPSFACPVLLMLMLQSSVTSAQSTVDCSQSYIVSSQSGPSSTCPASPELHWWPLGDVTYCHGWAATDSTGKTHLNAAKNIRCAADGNSFLYDQYAGNIDCSGSAVSKTFSKVCTVGKPPTLFDLAVNLECCGVEGVNTPGCAKGVPIANKSTTTNNKSYKNGILCAAPTVNPITEVPTTKKPTTKVPTTKKPTTKVPTTKKPTTKVPTTKVPTTKVPTTKKPTTKVPTTKKPTTKVPTTKKLTTM